MALVIHDRERAGNVFVGEALFVAALLRCVQHDFAALGLLVGVGCYSNPPIDGVKSILLVGIGTCKISVGTSGERIPNTSFSKQGHRYGAVYQLSHDGPPGTLRVYAMERRADK